MTRKVAVITGASSGIGRATALRLAAGGWHVVAVARTRAKLDELVVASERGGGVIDVEAVDAADGRAVSAMAARLVSRLGAPHLIVNSAGAGQWKFLEETTTEEAAAMLGAPFFAALNVSGAFMASMLAARRGVIIHVNSPASRIPWPGATVYASARFALRGLHEALCQDLRGTGVHSAHVVFGEVTSEYFVNNPGSHEHMPRISSIVPKLSPEDCAEVIVRVAARPRREVVAPLMLRAFYWSYAIMPGLVRWLASATGRKHQLQPRTSV